MSSILGGLRDKRSIIISDDVKRSHDSVGLLFAARGIKSRYKDNAWRDLDVEYNLFIPMPAASHNALQDLVEPWKPIIFPS